MKQSLGEFISTLRKAQGYTQAEVAEKLNVSNRTLSSWETDRTAPDIGILPALADLYGVTVDEILRCERQPKNTDSAYLSDSAKNAMRKNRYAKFCGKRILCTGLSLLGAVVFVAMSAVTLYTSAPLWLDILFMILGASGNAACVILIAYFQFSALRGEGLVFKDDYTEDNKAYALAVRRKTANAMLVNSLPYILGAIVFIIVYFALGLYDYHITVGGVNVQIDYSTPTAVLTAINGIIGLSLLLFGLIYRKVRFKNLCDDKQKTNAKHNSKLLRKLCGFGAIPIAISLIVLIVFASIDIESVYEVYFTAHSVEEVYKNFQTLVIEEDEIDSYIIGYDENREPIEVSVTYTAGEYYLDFQSENYVELFEDTTVHGLVKYYDLGNGFYFTYNGTDEDRWYSIYHLLDGVSIADATDKSNRRDFLSYYDFCYLVSFEFDGETYQAGNISKRHSQYDSDYYYNNGYYGYKFQTRGKYFAEDNEFRYELACYEKYSPLVWWLFFATTGVTILTCTVIWLVKRKKSEFTF